MTDDRRRDSNGNPFATSKGKLPSIPDRQGGTLDSFWNAVKETIEVLTGGRGSRFDAAVTWRDLANLGIDVTKYIGAGRPQAFRPPGNGVQVQIGNGLYATLSFEEFEAAIKATRLYKDLARGLNDATRFDALPAQVRDLLLVDIADEAKKRGADIRRVDSKLQTLEQSMASTVQEVTAAVGNASSGVRDTVFAYAEQGRSVAGKVTQIKARLDDVNGNVGVTIEEALFASSSLTDGIFGQYTLKIDAGGKVAGFGLANSVNTAGVGTSAFIVRADKFAIVASADSIADPTNPPADRIPFGVDTVNDVIYINGAVRINTGTGATLDSLSKSVTISAPTQVFKYTSGTPTPSTIVLTRTLNGGLTGTTAWTVVNGTYSGSISGDVSTITITPSLMSSNCTFRATVAGTHTDDFTLVKVNDGAAGADAITIFLTNEAHSLPTNASDVVTDYTGAGGTFKVYDGGTDVTTSCTFAYTGTYFGFSSAPSGTINTTTGVYSITSGLAATNATAYVEYQATYGGTVYGPLRFSIGKAKIGADGPTGGTGLTGTRGSRSLYRTSGSYTSSYNNGAGAGLASYRAQATTEMTAATGSSTKVEGDTVTFTNGTSYTYTLTWSVATTNWELPGVVIDGSLLVTGTVTATKLAAGTVTVSGAAGTVNLSAAGNNFGSQVPLAVERTNNAYSAFVVSDATSVTTNSTQALVEMWARQSVLKLNAYSTTGTGITLDVLGNNDAGIGVSATYGTAALTTFNTGTSKGLRLSTSVAGGTGGVAYAAYAYSGGGKIYAVDGLGPFTGFHDTLTHIDDLPDVGDIMVDVECIRRYDISNTLFRTTKSSAPNQKGAIGIASQIVYAGPATERGTDSPEPEILSYELRTVHVNALGEGQVSVCGEGGNIEIGDLIVTSSIPGKGMRQADDLVRSCTVARAREAVSFSGPGDVKLVACVYLCG